MNTLILAAIIGSFALFALCKPRYKMLITLVVMTQTFDILPRLLFNTDVWDIGVALLAVTWAQTLLKPAQQRFDWRLDTWLLAVFIGWMGVSFLWSVLAFDYSPISTVKASRHLIIGYLTLFSLLRLQAVDPEAMTLIQKGLFWLTFMLMPIWIFQYILAEPILFGLVTNYGEDIRAIPIFLPFIMFFIWVTLSRMLSGEWPRISEIFYSILGLTVIALTFTRGIYFAFLASAATMAFMLVKDRKVHFGASAAFLFASVVVLSGLVAGGNLDKVTSRFASGIRILTGDSFGSGSFEESSGRAVADSDTFTGRLKLLQERINMVVTENPLVGYGFIHEDEVPPSLRNQLKYGSIVNTPDYRAKYAIGFPYVLALLSVDIGWTDIVVKTGLVGFTLLISFVIVFLLTRMPSRRISEGQAYHFLVAAYLQVLIAVITMFNGNPFVDHVQIVMFMVAVATVSFQPAQQPSASTEGGSMDKVEKSI